jgi:predicted phosphodiesterase
MPEKEVKPRVHIAVFGDVHGHLRLMFQLCRLWQLEHRVQLDGVLLCGDLGFFPDLSNLDKATRRYSAWDPEEIGFARFFVPPEGPERDDLLERILQGEPGDLSTVEARIVWCHGNHEDFEDLTRLVGSATIMPVDRFGVLEWLRSGSVEKVAGIRVGAVGGGPERPDVDPPPWGCHGVWSTVTEAACDELRHEEHDVLITHCGPTAIPGLEAGGSELLSGLLRSSTALYHFYSHHEVPVPPATIGTTRSVWLAAVNFDRGFRGGRLQGRVHPGCMGILRWSGREDHEFQIVDEPWIRGVTGVNWHYL